MIIEFSCEIVNSVIMIWRGNIEIMHFLQFRIEFRIEIVNSLITKWCHLAYLPSPEWEHTTTAIWLHCSCSVLVLRWWCGYFSHFRSVEAVGVHEPWFGYCARYAGAAPVRSAAGSPRQFCHDFHHTRGRGRDSHSLPYRRGARYQLSDIQREVLFVSNYLFCI